jgi:hypothetical protein
MWCFGACRWPQMAHADNEWLGRAAHTALQLHAFRNSSSIALNREGEHGPSELCEHAIKRIYRGTGHHARLHSLSLGFSVIKTRSTWQFAARSILLRRLGLHSHPSPRPSRGRAQTRPASQSLLFLTHVPFGFHFFLDLHTCPSGAGCSYWLSSSFCPVVSSLIYS